MSSRIEMPPPYAGRGLRIVSLVLAGLLAMDLLLPWQRACFGTTTVCWSPSGAHGFLGTLALAALLALGALQLAGLAGETTTRAPGGMALGLAFILAAHVAIASESRYWPVQGTALLLAAGIAAVGIAQLVLCD